MKAEVSPESATHKEMANAIRTLSMDAVEKANSGHPGMPMGMADVATVLFRDFLKFDPKNPKWEDRDRFVLSAGHGSMLLYSLLYLTGYEDMTIEEIKKFRQLGSKTAGHPEYGHATGIETTTGPLGQGLANAVGMALAEKMMAARFGDLADHKTYAIAGDGCLMEGISQEAISFAGHLKLNKLIVLFDDNSISIDGPTNLSVSEDNIKRFQAAGWNTDSIDGHNEAQIKAALTKAQRSDKPTMIACKTTIAYGAPTKAGKNSSHGSPLGKEEIEGARTKLGWTSEPFVVPNHILASWRETGARGHAAYKEWKNREAKAAKMGEFTQFMSDELPKGWEEKFQAFKKLLAEKKPSEATRKSSQEILEILNPIIPQMIGGSADLTGSNNTKTKTLSPVTAQDFNGRYVYYGVREHAMGAIMNGLALHGGFIPYGGTFLVFSDYCRPAIRLAALMGLRVIFVMTHDSIGVGEDGPTHQPVEHLASLRAIPNLNVFRPCDATETAECWAIAIASRHTPSVLCLTRQNLPNLRLEYTEENLCALGGYVIREEASYVRNNLEVTLIASGSEVGIAVEAQKILGTHNIAAKVVSMPCTNLFDKQPEAYRRKVIEDGTIVIAIEAASPFGWGKYIGQYGMFIGMEGFGASGPAPELFKHFGITADDIVKKVMERL
jgi:transketolase